MTPDDKILKLEETEFLAADRTLEVEITDQYVELTIANPWAGDENHLGETGRINLTLEQACSLRDWLIVNLT